jgi:uncharacterized protein
MMEELKTNKRYPILIGTIVIVLVIWLAMGGSHNNRGRWGENNSNIITITGHGEVQAIPDIANISFTIKKEAKTVKEAQNQVAEVEKKVLESLKTNNVLEKDIKTVNVSFNPKYDYKYGVCNQYGCPPKNVIVGYEASENINLKIRSIDDTGKIIQDLGSLGVTDLFGPNFGVENKDGLKAQTRKQAIDDAKLKAKVLAKELGIHLGKITSFSESGNYPIPMYTNAKMDNALESTGSTPPVLPVGENIISSDVTITYKIR